MHEPFQIKLSKNLNIFSNVLLKFWSLHQILNILRQGWPSYPMYFESYRLWKTWLHKSVNKPVSWHHLIVNMLEGLKHLWNLHESTFIKICYISEGHWLRKPLLLVIFELLQLFVKTLTSDDKYSLCSIWNFRDLI